MEEEGADRWVELFAFPVLGAEDTAGEGGTILLLRDVTAARNARVVRDAFLGVLSHELRTPVTTIYGSSEILSRKSAADLSDERRREIYDDIRSEADRLYRLVENLLVLSRVERGADLRRSDPVLVQHVGRRVLAHEGSRWPDRQFEATIPVGLPAASGDEAYVEQILRNLLSNAAKYSPTGSRIDLVVSHEEDGVTIRVLDRGPGFAPSDLLRVFELFYRAPSAVKVAAGAGIGLYTSRVLAEAMGGRIWAANRTDAPAGTAESLGAEVGVWLPLSTLDPEV
jgi:two-component system, OmpR family, sensor histidine kinase KdpD